MTDGHTGLQTVKIARKTLDDGKEDSLKGTHQGFLSAFSSPFSELFLRVRKTLLLAKKRLCRFLASRSPV